MYNVYENVYENKDMRSFTLRTVVINLPDFYQMTYFPCLVRNIFPSHSLLWLGFMNLKDDQLF